MPNLAIFQLPFHDGGMSISWDTLRPIIDGHQRFVISSHVRPDADAIGSEMGLASLLQSLGKTVQIINHSPTPPNLLFLDPERTVKQLGVSATAADICAAEVEWGGSWRPVLVYAVGNDPLLGMRLLSGHKLVIEVVPGGLVEIRPHP